MNKKIVIPALLLLGLAFLLKKKKPTEETLPTLEILSKAAGSIEFLFNGATRRIKKQEQQSYEAGKYVLVAMADNSGSTFTLYDQDKIVKKYPNTFFNT